MGSAPTAIGGQAVIEGVMMRGPKGYAVSVRRASGAIQTLALPYSPLIVRYPSLNIPVLRGAVSLIEMMTIVGYIYAISLMKDVKRLFQYHGAEHKAVSAFEAGKELTVENVRPFTRLHPRCGTTFIAITLLVAIGVFAVFAKILVAVWPE